MTEQYWADCATQNCVWLFRVMHKKYPTGCHCEIYDDEGSLLEGMEEKEAQCECYVEVWETERVFLTRKEADEWGQSRPYAWGEKGQGWDIYGVPCDGMMVEFIGQHNKEFEGEVEYIGL